MNETYYYDTAQICENGHTITSSLNTYPFDSKPFCPLCGKPTITQCPHCSAHIQGDQYLKHTEYNYGFGIFENHCDLTNDYHLPAYCYKCGSPFPWTATALTAAKELIAETSELTTSEKETFNTSLLEITFESPKTLLSANRIKKLLNKIPKPVQEIFQSTIGGIVTEAVKRVLWP